MKLISKILLVAMVSMLAMTKAFADEPTGPKVSGVAWLAYWHAMSGAPGGDTTSNGTMNQFEIRRVYLNLTGNMAEDWSYKVTYEMSGTPQMNAFAKVAMIRWDINKETKNWLQFGLQPTLTWALSEAFWGYRPIHTAPRESFGASKLASVNSLSFGSSADYGIGWGMRPMPMLGISLQAVNGAGNKTAEANMQKKIMATVTVYPIGSDALPIEIYYDTEGGYKDPNGDAANRNGLGVFAGYKEKMYTVGVDYFMKTFEKKLLAGSPTDVKSNMLSVFGNVQVADKIRLLARFDSYTPVTEDKFFTGTYDKSGESLIIVGADCSYGPPNTHFMVDFQNSAFSSKVRNNGVWEDRKAYSLIETVWTVNF